MRTFLALDIGKEIRTVLGDIQDEMRRSEVDVRWVEPANIHLTLKFLGEVQEGLLNAIISGITEAVGSLSPFIVQAKGLGGFPSLFAIRVIWAGIEPNRQLEALHQRVEQAMTGLGFPPEKRSYRPHLTLGRTRSSRGSSMLKERIQAQANIEIGSLSVSEIHLFQSTLTPSGSRYQKLASASLRS